GAMVAEAAARIVVVGGAHHIPNRDLLAGAQAGGGDAGAEGAAAFVVEGELLELRDVGRLEIVGLVGRVVEERGVAQAAVVGDGDGDGKARARGDALVFEGASQGDDGRRTGAAFAGGSSTQDRDVV